MVGGGFGGKVDVIVEPLATLGAMKTGRPVRYVYSRSEEMQVSSTRSAEIITIKDGVMADGTIVARKVTGYVDCGAYSRQTPYALTKLAANAAGPYRIPNVSIDAYCVYTNRPPTSRDARVRGHDGSRSRIEVQMDKIAELVGLDPWTVRFLNAYRNGDMKPHRKIVEDATLIETMQAAAELVGPRAARRAAGDDVGATRDGRGRGADDGEAARHRDGRRQLPDRDEPRRRPLAGAHPRDDERLVQRRRSRPPTSARGSRPSWPRSRPRRWACAYEQIVVDTADTDTGPHDMGTFASRGTHRVGNAVKVAAHRGARRGPAARVRGAGGVGRRTSSSTAQGSVHVAGSPAQVAGHRGPRVAGPVPVRRARSPAAARS